MPKAQRGSIWRDPDGVWHGRYRNAPGMRPAHPHRRFGPGRAGEQAAADWMQARLEEVKAVRRKDPRSLRRLAPAPTLGELVAEYLGQHSCEREHVGDAAAAAAVCARGGEARRERRLQGDPGGPVDDPGARRVAAAAAGAIGVADREGPPAGARLRGPGRCPRPERRRGSPEPAAEVPLSSCRSRRSPSSSSWPAASTRPDRAVPLVVGLTGLRPEEWLALEWDDVDRAAGVVHVRRVFVAGGVRLYGKQAGSLRGVPLPALAAAALDQHPRRLRSPLVFGAPAGGHLDLHNWRARHWYRRSTRPGSSAAAVCAPAYVRVAGDRSRRPLVRARPVHGNQRRPDRPDLWASAPRCARPRPRRPRPVPRRRRGGRLGEGGSAMSTRRDWRLVVERAAEIVKSTFPAHMESRPGFQSLQGGSTWPVASTSP